MKDSRLSAVAAALVLAFGVTSSFTASAFTAGKIPGSKHDMTSAGGDGISAAAGNAFTISGGGTEICVFCHTPHAATATGTLPLWNRSVPTSTYTVYTSESMQGTVTINATDSLGSLACLSCHDGATSRNAMVNAPGSGLQGGSYTGTWTGGGADGKMGGSSANLGTDLTNDHPISIPYCGGGLTVTTLGAAALDASLTCADADFRWSGGGTTWSDAKISTKQIGSNQKFWLERSASGGTRNKGDLPMYSRIVGGKYTPWIECASCHDPHNSASATSNYVSFLRPITVGASTSNPNEGSKLCLSCHDK